MKKWSILIVVLIFIVVAFCLFFVVKSYITQFGKVYSKNINDWSSFADYVGGIGNTLISLASLIMIGFITILLGLISTLGILVTEQLQPILIQHIFSARQEPTK